MSTKKYIRNRGFRKSFNKIKTYSTIGFTLSASLFVEALYVDYKPDPGKYNTNSIEGYNLLCNDIFSTYAGGIIKKEIDELKVLPISAQFALIDKNWVITAAHVVDHVLKTRPDKKIITKHDGTYVGVVDRYYTFPGLDLTIAHLKEPAPESIQPISMHTDMTIPGHSVHIYSTTIHNQNADISGEHNAPCYTVCQVVDRDPAVAPGQQFSMHIPDHADFNVRTYGGDSGSPALVKVNTTGNPYQDYRICGVYNPAGQNLAIIWLGDPKVQQWITKIIAEAPDAPQPTATINW